MQLAAALNTPYAIEIKNFTQQQTSKRFVKRFNQTKSKSYVHYFSSSWSRIVTKYN
ncbi:hypothetical protein VCHA47P369_110020 [Vibrio chagasii]|nr:hypothetical protein VCHA34P114_100129 [Vibrio chagasii]CAH6807382.1 hypothetical protein VCHA36P168_110052 [Vibrio chagasii]CAH6906620.1 hypothetical protein VCHA43P282_100052 [Vibrio chagasii]CAH6910946.1 hypothetical protein VCHA48P435_100138 [Vibrio chagasii]CAH6916747.1 hypothetical protein VCHA47P369_110020 [Vibrio chagasii]